MIQRRNRQPANNSRKDNRREDFATKSRDYALWSFFSSVLTLITDPKDDYGLEIKCGPAYLEDSKWRARDSITTSRTSRVRTD